MLKRNQINKIFNIIIWGVFITFPLLFIPDLVKFDERGYTPIYINVFAGFLAIIIFYFNYNYAIPKFSENKKYLKYIFTLVISILLMLFILRLFVFIIDLSPSLFHFQGVNKLISSFLPRAILVIVAAHFIYNRVKSKKIEQEKEKAELKLLNTQIAPHFLFNTLNSLYSLAIVESEKTAQGILELSYLMRYVVSDAQTEKIAIKNELEHLENYIHLQKIRLTKETRVHYTKEGNFNDFTIAPLILIVFVENAFKYGVSTENESKIVIEIKITDQNLYFMVENDKMDMNNEGENTEIGLKNVISRLELIYKNKHILTIKEDIEKYNVQLKIELI